MEQAVAMDEGERLRHCMRKVAEDRDQLAFAELFDHFAPRLRSFSLSSQPGAALVADELAQETMIRVWEKAHTYRPDKAAVSTWVFTMARNYRIDQIRRNKRFVSDIDPEEVWNDIPDESTEADPFSVLQQKRTRDRIHDGLRELPPEQVQVIAKVFLEGKSHQETADELELPLGTVKSRIRLAVKKLELVLKR